MPNAADYAAVWELRKGLRFGEYEITNLDIGHQSVVLWNEYRYPSEITLDWVGTGVPTEDAALRAAEQFDGFVADVKATQLASGRWYECHFDASSFRGEPTPTITYYRLGDIDYGEIVLSYVGYAKRVAKKVAEKLLA